MMKIAKRLKTQKSVKMRSWTNTRTHQDEDTQSQAGSSSIKNNQLIITVLLHSGSLLQLVMARHADQCYYKL